MIGDATNVAFRLAGLAGRQGRAAVMVTSAVHRAVAPKFRWGESESVEIKGRHGMETVFPVIARATSATDSPSGIADSTNGPVEDPEGNRNPSPRDP